MLKVGTEAPAFIATSTKGPVDLKNYLGKNHIVLIFYPGDDTPVCTKQLCAIQDNYASIEQADTVVFGVNPGEMGKKQSFAERFGYDFPLIVDSNESIRSAYDVGKIFGLFFQQRIVYIIGKDKKIMYAKKGNPPVSELLSVIAQYS
ncbi:peroxiredoxin [Brevibacillus reuszeri]|uniref:thioredoxin-dependent peroxiredoxin n=1 Tax=Brevibacillus reuszeri TaxID=54915 RepID=A0A0K9YZM1_9BACL|nr:redoxin domain-containing protein [Brevibacillus reuszeri]KNB74183.1 peroxiredoxin [Brevibacillus reuszeri]MED1859813.1 redoxin domain-containing protein [Brevibacillus reuszeri]GED72393.1 peroxiredoxin [Brevibacillus reuszeri]